MWSWDRLLGIESDSFFFVHVGLKQFSSNHFRNFCDKTFNLDYNKKGDDNT